MVGLKRSSRGAWYVHRAGPIVKAMRAWVPDVCVSLVLIKGKGDGLEGCNVASGGLWGAQKEVEGGRNRFEQNAMRCGWVVGR